MYDDRGNLTWETELDIYGKVRNFAGSSLSDCPFRYQGQYEDSETGLYYNRFRYYDPSIGNYISQDPIRLAGEILNLYSYVHDTNTWLDIYGLSGDFGSGRGIHTANVGIYDSNGNLMKGFPVTMQSGRMTEAERALGFPNSTLATHTEARAVKNYPLSTGQRMEIIGQYPPCNRCRYEMRTHAVNGATIDYRWIDESTGKMEWIRYENNKKVIDSTSKNKKLHPHLH